MRRIPFNKLLLIGSFAVVTMMAACGHSVSQNTSGHGLGWDKVSATSGPSPLVIHSLPDALWYNSCTHRVEWYAAEGPATRFNPPHKYHKNDTLWFWNGHQWLSSKTSPTYRPGGGAGDFVIAWNSNNCTAIETNTALYDLSAQSRPGQVLNPTWSWNGKRWRVASVTSPVGEAPFGVKMVYDSASRAFLLWGPEGVSSQKQWPVPTGNSDQVSNRINEMQSMQLYLNESSADCLLHPRSPCSTTHRIVGIAHHTVNTWMFNGSAWTEEHHSETPPLLRFELAVYDPATYNVIMFGGLTGTYNQVHETWLWNGVTWTMTRPATIPQVNTEYSAMAYDPLLKGVVLYDTQSHTTWLWTGTNWEKLITTNKAFPQVLERPSMVFDPATEQLILTGGLGNPNTTWVLTGSTD